MNPVRAVRHPRVCGQALLLTALLLAGASLESRAEHDFTVKGSFFCTAQGVTMPIEGAVIGIMRDKSFAADPIVTEVQTALDGSFTAQVNAKDVDSYYAKVFLNDKQGVFLRDWWTLSVREYNSASRGKNSTSLVDLGGTTISRDGGKGTPECAIWQGGRHAWQEYISATGQRPLIGENGNYQIVMESTDSGIVWTSRDTTHWEINYGTGEYSQVDPVANPESLTYADLFEMYGTNVHEFGHALRQTADGSENHFSWDATRFFYGHTHALCDSSPAGVRDNAGFGFNEGWGDYWQESDASSLEDCFNKGVSPTNFDQESAVAFDLENLENALGTCAGIVGTTFGDALQRQRRNLMFKVLVDAGHEKIHSEEAFRTEFHQLYPACTLPAEGAMPTAAHVPVGALSHRQPPGPTSPSKAARIQGRLSSLPAEIQAAETTAKRVPATLDREVQATLVTKPSYLRGQLAYAQLLQSHLVPAVQKAVPSAAFLMTAAGEQQRAATVTSFDQEARAIALKTLTDERAALIAANSSAYAEDIQLLTTEIAAVQAGSDSPAATMLQDLGDNDGDEIRVVAPR